MLHPSLPSRHFHPKRWSLLLAFALVVLSAHLHPPHPAHAAAGASLFTITDPRGDDSGDGSIRYPLNYYGLQSGDLDLLEFSARRVRGGTEFEAVFANAIKSPARRTNDIGGGTLDAVARFGFYAQNIDIYIDTNRVPGEGRVGTLPGRKAMIEERSGWERAVILTPRPHDARSALKRSLLKSLKQELREDEAVTPEQSAQLRGEIPDEIERSIFFPNRIRVVGPRIRFFVPDEFLGGPARADWGYVVLVTGADVDARFEIGGLGRAVGFTGGDGLFILPVLPGGAQDRFGGRREDDITQPPILDMLLPPGARQDQVLSNYDPVRDRPVTLPAVVPADAAAAPGAKP